MTSTAYITGPIFPGMVIPYQTGWAYTVRDSYGNEHHMRNVTYQSASSAKAAMREAVALHNERIKV